AAVAAALDVQLPVSLERRLEAGIAVGDHKTSMLQDLEAGKPLELDCMSGAVIELADNLGIALPHTRAVHACVKLLDQLTRESSATRPNSSTPNTTPEPRSVPLPGRKKQPPQPSTPANPATSPPT